MLDFEQTYRFYSEFSFGDAENPRMSKNFIGSNMDPFAEPIRHPEKQTLDPRPGPS